MAKTKIEDRTNYWAPNLLFSRSDIERGLRLVASSYPDLAPLGMLVDGERRPDLLDTFVEGALHPPF